MDQDETWLGGRLGPGHIISDGDSAPLPPKGHSPQFLAHACCGQTDGWIKVPLGVELGIGPDDIVLDGDPAPLPQRGTAPNFWPMSIVGKWSPISATVVKLFALCCRTVVLSCLSVLSVLSVCDVGVLWPNG